MAKVGHFINMYLGYFANFQGRVNDYIEGKTSIWKPSGWISALEPNVFSLAPSELSACIGPCVWFLPRVIMAGLCAPTHCATEWKEMGFETKRTQGLANSAALGTFLTYFFICQKWSKKICQVGLLRKLTTSNLVATCLVPVNAGELSPSFKLDYTSL